MRRLSPYFALISSSSLDDDVHQELSVGEDVPEARDLVAELAVLRGELLLLEAGEAREAHLEDGLGLPLGEEVVALRLSASTISASGRPARRTNSSRP